MGHLVFYLCMFPIKLLLTEISVHTGNICSDIQGALTLLRSVHIRLECQNKHFLVWTSSSVKKRIVFHIFIGNLLSLAATPQSKAKVKWAACLGCVHLNVYISAFSF